LGRHRRAIEDFDRAILHDPRNAAAYDGRGDAYRDSEQYDRAAQDYSQAISLGFQNYEIFVDRGVAYSHLGMCQQAINDINTVRRLAPNLALAYTPDVTGSGTASGSFEFFGGAEGNSALYDNLPTVDADPGGLRVGSHTTYDFGVGNQVHIRRVIIKNALNTGVSHPSTWALDYSDDGLAWTEAGEYTMAAGQGITYSHDFPATGHHRFWRLHLKSTDMTGGSIWIEEVEMLEEDTEEVARLDARLGGPCNG